MQRKIELVEIALPWDHLMERQTTGRRSNGRFCLRARLSELDGSEPTSIYHRDNARTSNMVAVAA